MPMKICANNFRSGLSLATVFTLLLFSSLVSCFPYLRSAEKVTSTNKNKIDQDNNRPNDADILHDDRELMTDGTFSPLQCNNAILSDDSCLTSALSFRELVEEHLDIDDNNPLVIPCGQCVVVDITDGSKLTLPRGIDIVGRLYFPPTANIVLNTTAVFVQGQLDIAEPATGNAVTITLYGVEDQYLTPYELCEGYGYGNIDACPYRQNFGTKPIVVAGGKLNIQARDSTCPSWTRLISKESSAPIDTVPIINTGFTPGSDGKKPQEGQLELCEGDCDNDSECGEGLKCFQRDSEDVPGCSGEPNNLWDYCVSEEVGFDELRVDVDFASCVKAGDEILVTSASKSWNADHARTAISVDPSNGVITLDSRISGDLPGLNGPGEPEFAVEIATLSRSVTFEAQEDNPESQIGGHLIVYHTPDIPQILSGVHFRNFGQGGILGRYPVHFHLSGESPSTISGNVVTKSNQRCYVIHQTNDVTVENNVAYDAKGHCYITENGKEENNVFRNNLGARTRKLQFDNGQSDSNGGNAATFWIRNMRNEFYGNVAAGSEVYGWWFEFPSKYAASMLSTEPVSSFRDNVAHSISKNGMTTYKQGYFPSTPAVFDQLRIYKCGGESGFKSHFTGVLTIKNSLFADNKISVRYGVKNNGIILKDSKIIAVSNDAKLREGISCPSKGSVGVYASYNVFPSAKVQRAIVLDNVTMERFVCDSKMIKPYFDVREPQAYSEGMGDPIQASVTISDSVEAAKPYFSCGSNEKHVFLEDFSGGLGPSSSSSDPGFVIRNEAHMKAFLPDNACEPVTYGGSFPDGTKCNAFCKNACLRMFHISSGLPEATKLVLSQGTIIHTYYLDTSKFRLVLPPGSYRGRFFDTNNKELIAKSLKFEAFRAPRCSDYADLSSFAFATVAGGSSFAVPIASIGFTSGSDGKKPKDGELQLCEGDCDKDSECGDGLKCFQRDEGDDVPGCIGAPNSSWDYCVLEEVSSEEPSPAPAPTAPNQIISTGFTPGSDGKKPKDGQLQLCEGDCDKDSECGDGLKCFQRGEGDDVPGCVGTPYSTWDYCILEEVSSKEPTAAPAPTAPTAPTAPNQIISTGFTPGSDGKKPKDGELKLCEGDCDKDSECGDGLKCFQRGAGDSVPGCVGTPHSTWDYCILEEVSSEEPTAAPAPTAPTAPTAPNQIISTGFTPGSDGKKPKDGELKLCEGDCDKDSECGVGLKCFQRGEGDDVPGCIGAPNSSWDYCVLEEVSSEEPTPAPAPTAPTVQNQIISTGFTPGSDGKKPKDGQLQLCEGDCDKDSECGDGLKCFQRGAGDDVPGCVGTPYSTWDYCVLEEPTPAPAPTAPNQIISTGFTPGSDGKKPKDGELQLCEGDCDKDSECGVGLKCFQRGAGDDVPGCVGTPYSTWDYCVRENILT